MPKRTAPTRHRVGDKIHYKHDPGDTGTIRETQGAHKYATNQDCGGMNSGHMPERVAVTMYRVTWDSGRTDDSLYWADELKPISKPRAAHAAAADQPYRFEKLPGGQRGYRILDRHTGRLLGTVERRSSWWVLFYANDDATGVTGIPHRHPTRTAAAEAALRP